MVFGTIEQAVDDLKNGKLIIVADDEDREKVRSHVTALANQRIVITHGTDTMTATAAVLAGIPGKTIVLVGALAPARFAESDASFNLGMAFATVQLAPPGVYITMNGQVFRGNDVRKDRAQSRFVPKDSP